MPLHRLRAVFMRGGTSRGLVFRRADLPPDRDDWAPVFLAAMGSPDASGRQLDGMGGGVSSLSKVCVVGPASRADADVDYTFAQVAIAAAHVDYAGNCGNMSSAIGPFALDEGLVPRLAGAEAVVRIHNTNTGKIIVARFPVEDGRAAVDGAFRIDGVAGSGAAIRLDFEAPGGASTGQLLPTGRAIDRFQVAGLATIAASVVDAANPCVFVAARDLGLRGDEMPDELEADPARLAQLEAIRCQAAVAAGMAPDVAAASRTVTIPKVAFIAPPATSRTLSGRMLRADECDLLVRMISVGQPHRAVPVTGALCLAVACRIPGSVAQRHLGATATRDLRLAHPSGVVQVAADVDVDAGIPHARSATIYRTARRLFEGHVCYRADGAGASG